LKKFLDTEATVTSLNSQKDKKNRKTDSAKCSNPKFQNIIQYRKGDFLSIGKIFTIFKIFQMQIIQYLDKKKTFSQA
jgi:hypothetical protein